MSGDFATMLAGTLDNMKKKIEQANKNWENENDPEILNKFDKQIVSAAAMNKK